MKSKYEKIYKKLYSLNVGNFFKSGTKVQNSFVFQGSGNWDMYCEQINKNKEFELFNNVELISFDTIEEVRNYQVPKEKIIDFSREHYKEPTVEKYFLLIQK
jgi:hypothetical protein